MRTFVAIVTMLAVACHFALGCCACASHAASDEGCDAQHHSHDHDHEPAPEPALPCEAPAVPCHGHSCSAIIRPQAETRPASSESSLSQPMIPRLAQLTPAALMTSADSASPQGSLVPLYLAGERLLI